MTKPRLLLSVTNDNNDFQIGLDVVEQLLTLEDAVILRVDDVEIRSQPGGRLASTLHLFDLESVVVVRYREQESRIGHTWP